MQNLQMDTQFAAVNIKQTNERRYNASTDVFKRKATMDLLPFHFQIIVYLKRGYKDLKLLTKKGNKLVLAAVNNDSLRVLKIIK
jgi:hypothetical protein